MDSGRRSRAALPRRRGELDQLERSNGAGRRPRARQDIVRGRNTCQRSQGRHSARDGGEEYGIIEADKERKLVMAEARTYSNRSISRGQSVKKSSTKRRPKAVASDKVKTTGRKTATVRAATSTTRRGNSLRTTAR